jgi:hypothetical protein
LGRAHSRIPLAKRALLVRALGIRSVPAHPLRTAPSLRIREKKSLARIHRIADLAREGSPPPARLTTAPPLASPDHPLAAPPANGSPFPPPPDRRSTLPSVRISIPRRRPQAPQRPAARRSASAGSTTRRPRFLQARSLSLRS